jgi:hypothetical protein
MATQATLELFLNADSTVQVNVKQSDGTTAQTMTGWALAFVLRRTDGVLVLNKATGGSGITIGDGSGTDDRATVAIADTDTAGWTAGRDYEWSLWRGDAGSDIPLAYGPAVLKKAAAQV